MRRLTKLTFLLPAALFLAALVGPDSAAAANATMSVAPAAQTVDQGVALTVEVKQNADAPILGTQTDFEFDAGLLQITGVTKGPAFDGAALVIGVAVDTNGDGVPDRPQTKDEAIAEANTNGILQNVASYFIPGTGQVPAGEATFITVAMQAKPAGGTSQITLSSVEMFDTGANAVTVTPSGGTVTVTGPTASPSPTPCPGCTPTPSPTPKPATPTPTPAPPLEAFLTVSPSSTLAPPGAEFSITVMQNSNRFSTGAQTDLIFDPGVIQVVDVSRGKAYLPNALFVMGIVPTEPGATPPPKPATIAQANASGTLENVAAFFAGSSCVPPLSGCVAPGEAAFLTVKVKAVTDGRSPLTLANMEIIDELGNGVGVGANNGEIVVQTGAPHPGQQALGAVRLPTAGSDGSQDGGIPLLGLAVAVAAVTALFIIARRLAARR